MPRAFAAASIGQVHRGRLRDGRPVLAIPVGTGRNEIFLAKLRGLRASPGFRVSADGVGERCLEGFYQEEGRLYLYGPWEPGVCLEEVLQQVMEIVFEHMPADRGLEPALEHRDELLVDLADVRIHLHLQRAT